MITTPTPALLVIDVQQGMDAPRMGTRNNPAAERRIVELLASWREARRPVIHVQHLSHDPDSPLHPDAPGHALKREVGPIEDEPLFPKTTNSAFLSTPLEVHLHREGITSLVLVGLTTDHCVSSTARSGSDLGFDVTIVEDATATFERKGPDGVRFPAEQVHRVALSSLYGEFAQVRSTDALLAHHGGGADA